MRQCDSPISSLEIAVTWQYSSCCTSCTRLGMQSVPVNLYTSDHTASWLLETLPESDWGSHSPHFTAIAETDPLTRLYKECAAFLAHSEEKAAVGARTHLLRLLVGPDTPCTDADSTRLTEFLLNPPMLVLASLPPRKASWCHYRATEHCVSKVIFIEMDEYMVLIEALRPLPYGPAVAAAREVLKAAILHELAHCVTALSRQSFPNELPAAPSGQELHNQEVSITLEKFCAPWDTQAEAGRWLEYQVFGGIVGYDDVQMRIYYEPRKGAWIVLRLVSPA
ncbi:hypothetical protein C8J57DRAFT_118094 [Mycena rebaudengoi]|nr:hypothetical protein C8J57DRAFT_118094 [Mycena rebaudengoi]